MVGPWGRAGFTWRRLCLDRANNVSLTTSSSVHMHSIEKRTTDVVAGDSRQRPFDYSSEIVAYVLSIERDQGYMDYTT